MPDQIWPSCSLQVLVVKLSEPSPFFAHCVFLCVIKVLEVMCSGSPLPSLGPEVNLQGFHRVEMVIGALGSPALMQ